MAYEEVFSEFEVLEAAVKIGESQTFESIGCIGKVEETANVRTVTKKCRGIERKKRTKGTGTGEVKVTLHVPYSVYVGMYGMEDENLKDGVVAYGENSVHPEFVLVEKILDEDGNVKFKAYPRCIISEGPAPATENGAENVEEVEVTLSYMPDEYGYGCYEAIESEITEETMKTKWMTAFTPELVRVVSM